MELSREVIDVLSAKGISSFTTVQAESFEPVFHGQDVICRSRTGTGKTLAFGLPSITRLSKLGAGRVNVATGERAPRGRLPSMVVLCPTRELAKQVADEIELVSKPLGLDVLSIYGGVSYDPQARQLRNGVDIVVGTPGRTIDHIEKGNLDLAGKF